MKRFYFLLWLCIAGLSSCSIFKSSEPTVSAPKVMLPTSELEDRLLGSLVGSAIGDAMGAPTEMWSRDRIQAEYGHITGLDAMVRAPSPEGTWAYNLPAGGSTDDTRWKALMVDLITGTRRAADPRPDQISPSRLAELVVDRYVQGILAVQGQPEASADSLEAELQKVLWLKEWEGVANAYLSGDLDKYADALSQFYGGEMVCGGMLFAPLIGAVYPGAPDWAYEQAHGLDIYDIGYARDIAGLTAAMVAEAMQPGSNGDSLRAVLRKVDPKGYFRSRLVGRTAYEIFRQALDINQQVKTVELELIQKPLPVRLAMSTDSIADKTRYIQWSIAYQALDQQLFRMPFHPAEIWLVTWTAMLVCDFDFRQTLAFIVNFGRDNDTSAAVAGAILGAMYGAKALPSDLVEPALKANAQLGFDLLAMTKRLTQSLKGS